MAMTDSGWKRVTTAGIALANHLPRLRGEGGCTYWQSLRSRAAKPLAGFQSLFFDKKIIKSSRSLTPSNRLLKTLSYVLLTV